MKPFNDPRRVQKKVAVAAAYGFDVGLTNEQILEKLLALNIERANDETKSAAKQRNAKKISRMKSEHEMI